MNRIYKVLFNKTLGVYAAVSELASVKGKKAAKALAIGSVLAAGLTHGVQAAEYGTISITGQEEKVTYSNPSNKVTATSNEGNGIYVVDSQFDLIATEGNNEINGYRSVEVQNYGGPTVVNITAQNGKNIINITDPVDPYAWQGPVGVGAWLGATINMKSADETVIQYTGDPSRVQANQHGIDSASSTINIKAKKLTVKDMYDAVLATAERTFEGYGPGGNVTIKADDIEIDTLGTTSSGMVAQIGSKIKVEATNTVNISGEGRSLSANMDNSVIEMTAKNANFIQRGDTYNGVITGINNGKVFVTAEETITVEQTGANPTSRAVLASKGGEVTLKARNLDFAQAEEVDAIEATDGTADGTGVGGKITLTADENIKVTAKGVAMMATGNNSELNVSAKNIDISSTNEKRSVVAQLGGQTNVTATEKLKIAASDYGLHASGKSGVEGGKASKLTVVANDIELTANKEVHSIAADGGATVDVTAHNLIDINATDNAVLADGAGSQALVTAKTIDISGSDETNSVEAMNGGKVVLTANADEAGSEDAGLIKIYGKNHGLYATGSGTVTEGEETKTISSDITVKAKDIDIRMSEGRGVTAEETGNVTILADNTVTIKGSADEEQQNTYAAIRIEDTGGSVEIAKWHGEKSPDNRIQEVNLFGANGVRVLGPTKEEYKDRQSVLTIADADVVRITTKNTTVEADNAGDGIIVTDGGKVSVTDIGSLDVSAYRRGLHIQNGGSIEIDANGDKETDGYINITSVGNGDAYAALYAENSDTTKLDNDISLKATKDVTLEGYNGIKATGPNTHVEIEAGGKVTVSGAGDKHEELEGLTRDGIYIKSGDRFDPASGLKDVQITASEVEVKGAGRGINIEDGGDVLIKADKSVLVSGEKTQADAQVLGGIRIMNEGSVEIANKTDGERMDSVTLTGSNGIDVTGSTDKQAVVKVSGAQEVDIKALESKDDDEPDGIYVKKGGEVGIKDVGNVTVTGQKRGIHIENGGETAIEADGNLIVKNDSKRNTMAVAAETENNEKSTVVLKAKNMVIDGEQALYAKGAQTDMTVNASNDMTVYGDIDALNGAKIDVKALGTGIIGNDDEQARIHSYGGTADNNSSVSVSITGEKSRIFGTAWSDDPANDKIHISLENGATWKVGTDMPKGASVPDGINSRITSLKLDKGGTIDLTYEKNPAVQKFKTVQTQDLSGDGGHLIQRVDMTKGYVSRFDSDRLDAETGGPGTHTIHVSQIASSGKTPNPQVGYLVRVKNPDANLNFKADTKQLWELGDRWKDVNLFTRSDGATGKEWYLGLKDTPIITPTAHAALVLGASSAQYSLYYTQLSDLRKRLGEVRNDVRGKVQDGLWAQVEKHKDSIDSFENSTLEQDVYRMTVGFDRKKDNWLFGGNLKYADIDQRSNFSTSHAKGDAKSYGLNLYATWQNEDGYYSDIVLTADKYHNHLQTHTATDHKRITGDLSTYGLGASIEVGRKMYMDDAKLWFAEPQGQLSYYWIKGDDFKMSNGLRTKVKNFDGLNLRVGGVLGREFVNSDGTKNQFYAKAGFRQELTAHDKMKLNDNWYSHSMSNTGFYYGLGWDFLVKDNLKIYGEVEREDGDKYTKDYQINIGMKYAF